MLMAEHPDTALRRQAHSWVEQRAIAKCSSAIVTNENAKTHYLEKYPYKNSARIHVVENGYDEQLFEMAQTKQATRVSLENQKALKIVHSGSLYPDHRDPTALLRAIKNLEPNLNNAPRKVEILFRATGYDDYYEKLINEFDLHEYVKLGEPISYIDSIVEMLETDALLLIQGKSCNNQIPAKLYEYLRSGRPILGLTDPHGATARKMQGLDGVFLADNESEVEIETVLRQL